MGKVFYNLILINAFFKWFFSPLKNLGLKYQ